MTLKVHLTRNDNVERVTRIELAWPAWKTRTEMLWLGSFLMCKGKGLTLNSRE
jgi:hypothetical protein